MHIWAKFAAQRLQILQKFEVRGKSFPCNRFCTCWTLRCNIPWIPKFEETYSLSCQYYLIASVVNKSTTFYFNVNQLQDITKEKKCGMITPRIWTSITKIPTNFIPGSLLYKVITYRKNQFGWILQIIRFFDRATIMVFQSRADNILRNEVAWKHSNFAGWTKQNTKIRITQTLGVSFLKY